MIKASFSPWKLANLLNFVINFRQIKINKKKYIFNFYFSNLWKKFSKFVSAGISCSNESLDLFRQTARILVYLILNEIHSELIRIQSRKSNKARFFQLENWFSNALIDNPRFSRSITRRWKFSSSHQNRNNSTYLGKTWFGPPKVGIARRQLHYEPMLSSPVHIVSKVSDGFKNIFGNIKYVSYLFVLFRWHPCLSILF